MQPVGRTSEAALLGDLGTVVNAIAVANANATAQNPKPWLRRRRCNGERIENVIGLSLELR